jgi:hypothetical protein
MDPEKKRQLDAISQAVTGDPNATWESLKGEDLVMASKMAQQRGIETISKPQDVTPQGGASYTGSDGRRYQEVKDANNKVVGSIDLSTGKQVSYVPPMDEKKKDPASPVDLLLQSSQALQNGGQPAAPPVDGAAPAAPAAMPSPTAPAMPPRGAPGTPQSNPMLGQAIMGGPKQNEFGGAWMPAGGGSTLMTPGSINTSNSTLAAMGFKLPTNPQDLVAMEARAAALMQQHGFEVGKALLQQSAKTGGLTAGESRTPWLPIADQYPSWATPPNMRMGDQGSAYEGMPVDEMNNPMRQMSQGGSMTVSEPSVIQGLLSGKPYGVMGASPERVSNITPLGSEQDQRRAGGIESAIAQQMGGQPMAQGGQIGNAGSRPNVYQQNPTSRNPYGSMGPGDQQSQIYQQNMAAYQQRLQALMAEQGLDPAFWAGNAPEWQSSPGGGRLYQRLQMQARGAQDHEPWSRMGTRPGEEWYNATGAMGAEDLALNKTLWDYHQNRANVPNDYDKFRDAFRQPQQPQAPAPSPMPNPSRPLEDNPRIFAGGGEIQQQGMQSPMPSMGGGGMGGMGANPGFAGNMPGAMPAPPPPPTPPMSNPLILEQLAKGVRNRARLVLPSGML